MSLANLILNFSMNLFARLMSTIGAYYYFIIGFEICTFIAEALVLFFICKKKKIISFLASFLANVFSLGIGLLINNSVPDTKTTIVLIVVFGVIYSLAFLFNLFFYLMEKNH